MLIYLSVFGATMLVGVLLVSTQNWHGSFSADSTFGVQKFHTTPTPRIGGIAIVAGLLVCFYLASPDIKKILGPMLLAAIPAFGAGLIEDFTKKVGVKPRLIATIFSGALACILTGIAMQNTGLPPLDWALRFFPLAVVFTAVAVGGMANAINIIDGFNGLASGAVAIMLGALGLIAHSVGDTSLAQLSWLMATVVVGFVAVNWPFGKIFLGDGGAYLIGFVLAWICILLPMRNPQVTGWVILLVCAYPVLEVAFSVHRRFNADDQHSSMADDRHMHHLIYKTIVRQVFGHMSNKLQNGMTSPFCWLGVMLPAAWAVIFAQNTSMLILGFVLSIGLYAFFYGKFEKLVVDIAALKAAGKH